MEPGSSRESPTGSRGPEPADLREETPGEEANDSEGNSVSILKGRGGDGHVGSNENTEDKMRAECEDDEDTDTPKKTEGDEEGDGKYEEELDPRIQACWQTW